jgi:hypothetical protein
MDVSPPFSPRPASQGGAAIDPRLQPTPDYGTLGPGSDATGFETNPNPVSAQRISPRKLQLIAAAIGMIAALVAGSVGSAHPAWHGLTNLFRSRGSAPASAKDAGQLDRMKPQKQAEMLLEAAVGHSEGAVDQISSRVDRWQGKVEWNSQIATLTTAALNSNDLRVRESGVEVELAAYGLSKNSASVEYVLKTAKSPNHGQKIWALWALGLMANRGVETDRVMDVLTGHLKEADIDSRRWAVEGLALSGSDGAIGPLLATMHDDASPLVRERAACSLAESGLFTREQRMTAVPQLVNYTDDNSLDAQTQGWAFQALGDITHQRLPKDAAAWREWYVSRSNSQ